MADTKQKPARVVLISGHHFGAEALRGIVSSNEYKSGKIKVELVLSLHPQHALSTVGYEDLHILARQLDIPGIVFHTVRSQDSFEVLKSTPHDYLIAAGISELVPKEVLDLPAMHNNSSRRHLTSHACVGMHPTLLPTGRGRAPLPWTIIYGLKESGVTMFLLEEKPDAGAIIGTRALRCQFRRVGIVTIR